MSISYIIILFFSSWILSFFLSFFDHEHHQHEHRLTALAPVLKEKGEAAEIMITQVTAESEAADKVRVKVEADEVVVAKQAAEVKVIADDAQADLDVAMPALAKALGALDKLEKSDITGELIVFLK